MMNIDLLSLYKSVSHEMLDPFIIDPYAHKKACKYYASHTIIHRLLSILLFPPNLSEKIYYRVQMLYGMSNLVTALYYYVYIYMYVKIYIYLHIYALETFIPIYFPFVRSFPLSTFNLSI